MENLEVYLDGFKLNYEKFLIGCDALEEEGIWPLEELGQMDAYFANDLMCTIIRLIAADGAFVQEEIDYLNAAIGFSYTAEELAGVYADQKERIDALFENELRQSIDRIAALNPELAGTFREMLRSLCRIIIASDSVITQAEKDAAAQLQAILE